jgi:riboflavin kinase/FMN adenylyltransferase
VGGASFKSVTNVGFRPTFKSSEAIQQLSVESFLLDESVDLYSQKVRLKFFKKIRSEQKFASVDMLTEQIKKDVEAARFYFSKNV